MSRIAWTSILDCTKSGPRSTLANIVAVLQRDPLLAANIIWRDEFLDRVLTANSPPREWRDDDDTRIAVYLQDTVKMTGVTRTQVADAIHYVARQRNRHCVQEWMTIKPWDGIDRIALAFEDYWGAESAHDQPTVYLRAISANLFIGMVARVYRPGCQLDTMVIFEGPQGIGKSRALRVLGGEWYMLAAESVAHKDFFQAFPGKWIVEVGEMDSFNRAERERVKLAISTPTDRYRSSYGRRAEDHPRQCVFAGTTNRDDYGNDDTGLRRFLPLRCGLIDCARLELARPQLFAEALAKFQAGATWWETPVTETQSVQRDRQADDAWTDTVLGWLIGRHDTTSSAVLVSALKFREADIGRAEQLRVASILRLNGWKRQTIRQLGVPTKGWVRTDDVTDVDSVSFS